MEQDFEQNTPEYRTLRYQAESRLQQIEAMKELLNDAEKETSSHRYLIGTALYDILRHPLHPLRPMQKITGCIRTAMRSRHPESSPQPAPPAQAPSQQAPSQPAPQQQGPSQQAPQDQAPQEQGPEQAGISQPQRTWLIKCPAPVRDNTTWGDYHFCVSLADALQRQGERAEIELREEWNSSREEWNSNQEERNSGREADIVLVLRGMHRYEPERRDGTFYVMWNISHPDDIPDEEYNLYDLVFVASDYYAEVLSRRLTVPVFPLLQCTDTRRFYITEEEKALRREDLIFVGNGREDGRLCVNWAAACGAPLKLYGDYWKWYLRDSAKFVVAKSIANTDIRALYVRAKATLNDHHPSMKGYQFINNRVFDALACGLPVISDGFDELRSLFPDEILYYHDRDSFLHCLNELDQNYEAILQKTLRAGERVRREFTFDARASALIRTVNRFSNTEHGYS